jgi:hypothetical protein
MKTLILATAALATLFIATESANAGDFHIQVGYGGGYGYNQGYGYNNFGNGHLHHNVNPYVDLGHGHYDWHDTTHQDWIPGRWERHGCHYHWVPGRWVTHYDGHYDLHH